MEDSDLPEEMRREFIGIIRKECDRLNLLVELLDLDHARAMEFHDVDVASLLDEVIRLSMRAGDSRAPRLRRETLEGLPPLHCNRALIQRALLNLTANAIQASVRGGEIVLSAHSTHDQLCLEVRDQRFGPGERAERGVEVLDPTREEPGLAVVREIVARHGGMVRVVRNNVGVHVAMSLPRK